MGIVEAVAWALFGGFLVEVVGLYELRTVPSTELPRYLLSKRYWVTTVVMVAMGGVLDG